MRGTSESTRAITRFLTEVGLRHRLWAATTASAGHALVVGVALCIVDMLAPAWLVVGIAAGAGWVALAWLVAFWRGRVSVERVDAELGLKDRLLTWIGLRRRPADPMVAWLERDLEERLRSVPLERRRNLWRRSLGPLRYLLPVLVLLLVLRQFAPLMPPTHLGDGATNVAGAKGDEPGRGGKSADGERTRRSKAKAPPRPQREESAQSQPKPKPEHPRPTPEHPLGAPKPPLRELRPRDEFVVPKFVAEGPARRALVGRAVLEEGPEAGAAPAAAARAASRSGPGSPPPVEEDRFQRARESALRSRFVAPEERAFVARYFDVLARRLQGAGPRPDGAPRGERRK